jgi:hypothetical protein
MKFDEMLEIRPAYVPSGYRFRRSLHGKIFDGFDSELDQVMLIYGAGWTDEAATRPLRVYIGPSKRWDGPIRNRRTAGSRARYWHCRCSHELPRGKMGSRPWDRHATSRGRRGALGHQR